MIVATGDNAFASVITFASVKNSAEPRRGAVVLGAGSVPVAARISAATVPAIASISWLTADSKTSFG